MERMPPSRPIDIVIDSLRQLTTFDALPSNSLTGIVRDGRTTGAPGHGIAWVLGVFLATLIPYLLVVPHVLANLEPPTGDQPHH